MEFKSKFWAFDLEMNKPSNKIIQIGLCVFDLDSDVTSEASVFVNPDEPINPFITKLTGISDSDVVGKLSLRDAWATLEPLICDPDLNRSPVTWGGGDLRTLKEQLGEGFTRVGGLHREIDIKTIVQTLLIKEHKKFQGGLAKSLTRFGLRFEGTKHNAGDDAYNTAMFAKHLFKGLTLDNPLKTMS